MVNKKFNYNTLEELKNDIANLKLNIPISEDLEILKSPIKLYNKTIPNALAVNPMEGCDGTLGGKPSELTLRRYERFASGGSGLLWGEATAVVNDGRANPRQLYICRENASSLKEMNNLIERRARENFGDNFKPYKVIQLTHSGRYSKPSGNPEPIIGVNNPCLDKFLPKKYHIITDAEIEKLEDSYVNAAVLSVEAGYDAVDIKSCHRYLNSELLSGFTRRGNYGGSFENRTRFLLNTVDKIKDKLGDSIDITLRLNVYDAIPYPYGWGVDKDDFHKADLSEPIRLVNILSQKGIKLINISCGNPYYNPHVGRPYDNGSYLPPVHPLQSAAKMLNIIREIQKSAPYIAVVATGLSWFRQLAPYIAAGGIKDGWFKLAGFGRQAFAYPDYARDIIEKGCMDKSKSCITCSKCTEIMRDGGMTGCVVRDSKIYAPIYTKGRQGKPSLSNDIIAEHI